jgi:hypothetical protein
MGGMGGTNTNYRSEEVRLCTNSIIYLHPLQIAPKASFHARLPLMKNSGKSVKKLSVLLSADLHLQAKRQALLNDQSLTDLIVSLLNNYLDSVDSTSQEKSLRAEGGN